MRLWLPCIARLASICFCLLLLAIAAEIALGWRCKLDAQIPSPSPQPAERKIATAGIKEYLRPEDDTFLSYPEWYIVWSYQEKADFQKEHLPSGFPYFAAVRQYWSSYCCIARAIRGKYPFNMGEQVMLVVIGTSFSAEYILKGAYEKSVGRLSEWSSGHLPTREDDLSYHVAREYADFVHVRPFYEFHFARQVPALWKETSLFGPHLFRKWERKFFLTVDYAIEAFYCWAIEKLTHLTYGFEPAETYAWVENTTPAVLEASRAKVIKKVAPNAFVVDIPRYQEFTSVAVALAQENTRFIEVAGNTQILISAIAPMSIHIDVPGMHQIFTSPILTRPGMQRMVLVCDTGALSANLLNLRDRGVTLEHIYDY